jgi:hypothetical protein
MLERLGVSTHYATHRAEPCMLTDDFETSGAEVRLLSVTPRTSPHEFGVKRYSIFEAATV